MSEPAATAANIHGRLQEGAHFAGYSFERACGHLEWLLEADRWKLGGQFGDVNTFLASIKLDQFRIAVDQRKRIAQRIKELQPDVSQRTIAKVMGVSHTAINDDLRVEESFQPDEDNSSKTDAETVDVGRSLPPEADLGGAEAAARLKEITATDQRREERRQEQTDKIAEVCARETAPPDGTYDVIVIDPPWPMEKIERDVRPNQTALLDYPTMSEAELQTLTIPAADDCHAWLWTTHRFLPMAFRLLDGWGLRYVCTFTWHKPGGFQPVGLPQYNCEFALYARRGSPSFVTTKGLPVCFDAPRGEHSEKPDAFYDMVRRVTAGQRLDMFNRRMIEGFAGWGNEAAA